MKVSTKYMYIQIFSQKNSYMYAHVIYIYYYVGNWSDGLRHIMHSYSVYTYYELDPETYVSRSR